MSMCGTHVPAGQILFGAPCLSLILSRRSSM
jgi:hypothetical protein